MQSSPFWGCSICSWLWNLICLLSTCRYYPREHRAVLCTDGNDDSCLRGEGLCLSNRNVVTLRYDNQNLGIKRLGEWRETTVQIAKSCSCKIFRGSMFGDFVQKWFNFHRKREKAWRVMEMPLSWKNQTFGISWLWRLQKRINMFIN